VGDQRGWIGAEALGAHLKEILRVALAQVLYARDVGLGGGEPVGKLLPRQSAMLAPSADEVGTALFRVADAGAWQWA
jgi:hypothetical protein